MPARKDCRNALPTALPSHSAAAKEPVLLRVICCSRHLSAALTRWIAFQPWLFLPSKWVRDDSLGRKRIGGIWSATAGRRARRRLLTPAPSSHQWGMEGLGVDEKNECNFTGTSENQWETELSARGWPPEPTDVSRRQKGNQKELKEEDRVL